MSLAHGASNELAHDVRAIGERVAPLVLSTGSLEVEPFHLLERKPHADLDGAHVQRVYGAYQW